MRLSFMMPDPNAKKRADVVRMHRKIDDWVCYKTTSPDHNRGMYSCE
jgi:hypothetical protein